jgi:hypothetical protein
MRAIPPVELVNDPHIRLAMQAIKENLEILMGDRGRFLDRAITVSDLKGIGILGVDGEKLYNPNAEELPGFSSSLAATLATADSGTGGGLVKCEFDATSGAAETAHDLNVLVPNNAVIVRAFYEVTKTFKSATDAAEIALGIATDSAEGIVAAIAISDGTNPWDAGFHDGIPDGTAANFVTKATASRQVQATVGGGEALTDGKLNLFIEYVISAA